MHSLYSSNYMDKKINSYEWKMLNNKHVLRLSNFFFVMVLVITLQKQSLDSWINMNYFFERVLVLINPSRMFILW